MSPPAAAHPTWAPLATAGVLLVGLALVHVLTAPAARSLGALEVPVVTDTAGGESPERLAAIRYGEPFTLREAAAIDVEVSGSLPVHLDLALVADHGAVTQLRQHLDAPTTLTIDALEPGAWSLRGLAEGPREGSITLRAALPSRAPWLLPLGLALALPGLGLAVHRRRRS